MSDEQRIQQFRQMAESDPTNELGHFSLGRALMEAGQFEEAIKSLSRAIRINPRMSKGHQLLAESYERAGERDQAIEAAMRGAQIADEQGDRIPHEAMASMLGEWGAPIPKFRSLTHESDTDSGAPVDGFRCARCGGTSGKMDSVPIRGELGEKIIAHTCKACWTEWIAMGTKVINELGIVLTSPQGGAVYDQYMAEFLQLEGR
ncbi:MAG: Fe(2+)-trafficking protein [Planctomycetota bacterium]|jgi:tetratricopeptide (TPR) repeat protein